MIKKLAYSVSNFQEIAPRRSADMYTPPPGWQVASYVPSALGRIAQKILSRAVDEGWYMPSEIPLNFEGKQYLARYQIHGKNQFNPKNHPGIGLYERVSEGNQVVQKPSRHIGDKLDDNFFVGLKNMCGRLGCDPRDMLALMHLEAGLDPNITRPHHGARGLNQMIPSVLKGKAIGWQGTIDEYGNLSAAQQLPWIEKYFRSIMNTYKTGPLNSLTLLYLANFWPASLKNPAIQEHNPNAIVLSKDKYPREYEENKGLDVNKDGVITYNDIDKIISSHQRSVANSDVYARMDKATGTQNFGAPEEKSNDTFLARVEKMLDGFLSSASTNHNFTIFVRSDDFPSKLEYASILKSAIEEELQSKANVHTDGSDVEVVCTINADEEKAADALKQLCFAISDVFEYATKKIGGVKTQTIVVQGQPCYQELDINLSDINHRKFLMKFNEKR